MQKYATFKQFLLEGGKATENRGTVRATKKDIELAIKFISSAVGVSEEKIKQNLLGSTPHTLMGLKADSGDIDIAFETDEAEQERIIQNIKKAADHEPVKIGSNTFSFAIPTYAGRKVQVDIMFFPSEKWARWIHYSDPKSKHKGKIRNALLRSVAAHSHVPGKDLVVKDDQGNVIVRVRRSLKNDEGLVRLHKVAPLRKDGKGRVKALVDASEKDIKEVLKQIGQEHLMFSMDKDQLLDPDKVAESLFGKGVKAKDLLSAEQVAQQILKLKNAKQIVQDAVGPEMNREEVPSALAHLLD